MKKFPRTLSEVQALHQLGQLDDAKQGYLALLEMDDQQVIAWHYLGILYAELGEFKKAYDCLNKAIALEPQDASLYLHLANVLKAQGKLDEAIQQLQDAIKISPQFPALQNNLGSIYFAQEKWSEAIKHYRAAINLQSNYADAYYNLGLALNRDGLYEEAYVAFQSLLDLSPEHPGGLFQYGCLLMRSRKYVEALIPFKSLETSYPTHAETQINLATCYLHLGQLDAAKTHYLRAIEVTPNDTQALFNLGVISMQQGHIPEVLMYYQRALAINPNQFEVHNNLAVSYLALKDTQSALTHFTEALRLQPDNAAIQHMVKALRGGQPLTRASSGYIEQLFDSYADHYDSHLMSSLHYALPAQMHELALSQIDQTNKLTILDLGCGTGLCGQQFKPLAAQLVGVDLSQQMLKEAERKHCYDHLFHQDIFDYLTETELHFDLVIAADLIVYLGQLHQLFPAVHRVLNQGKWFLFNYERGGEEDYEVQETGRFKHNPSYLVELIKANAFEVVAERDVSSRFQDGKAVESYVYLLKKI